MEDILGSIGKCHVSEYQNSPYAEHPHFALYKYKPGGSSQEKRRMQILDKRKSSRYDLLSHIRDIEEGCEEESSEGDYDQIEKCYKKPKRYKNFLMLSEWLVDVSEDFDESYIALPCPGLTKAYAKNGYLVNSFPSYLPGGNRKTVRNGYAVLDCIWSATSKTFFILDLIMWVNQPYMDCDTIFRMAWLDSRMEESAKDATEISKANPFRFQRISPVSCSKESLTKLMAEPMPFDVSLDGILFYHKDSHYTHGPTPLVVWLKPFMLPEILGVEVPEMYMKEKPLHYTNINNHIIEFDGNKKKKKKKEMMQVSEDSEVLSASLISEEMKES